MGNSPQRTAQLATRRNPARVVGLEPDVAARREALDATHGAYTRTALRQQMKALVRQYPEVAEAIALHVMGKAARRNPEFSVATIAAARPYKEVRTKAGGTGYRFLQVEGDRQERAEAAMARVRELSEWSLLHAPNLHPDGTVTLLHGSEGRASEANRVRRFEQGTYRAGTSFTDKRTVALSFAVERRGLRQMIQADVPVSAVSIWHPMFLRSSSAAADQHEYVLAGGPLRRVRQITEGTPATTPRRSRAKKSAA